MVLTLHGYHFSVYVRIARMLMIEKDLTWSHVEVDPFGELPLSYQALNPFGRVPTLNHDGFVLYETGAIVRYLDEAFNGKQLQPDEPRQRARMNQIIAVADSYVYWPLVRQVYSHRVFRPAAGESWDEAQIGEGLQSATKVLAALEALASPNEWLCAEEPSLADFHLGAMIGCFIAAPEGARMLMDYPRLHQWWDRLRQRASYIATNPGLPISA
jgi:glutathione S-transferase